MSYAVTSRRIQTVAGLLVAMGLVLGCAERPRQTIEVAAPTPPATTTAPQTTSSNGLPAGATDPAANPEIGGVPPGAALPSSGNAGGLPGTASTAATALQIVTKLDDGSSATLSWDGRSFKGNDKWDLLGQ